MKILHEIAGMSPADIKEMLEANAYDIKEETYFEGLPESEVSDMKDEFVNSSVKLARLEEKLKDTVKELKDQMKPVKQRYTELREVLKSGQVEQFGPVYYLADYEAKEMVTVSPKGEIIKRRPLYPNEMQLSITSAPSGLRKVQND